MLIEKHIKRNVTILLVSYEKKKKDIYANLGISKVTDNRAFWKIAKAKILDKVKIRSKIALVEDEKILPQDAEIVTTFN